MAIEIEPCRVEDAETMITTGEAAFANDALNNAIFDPSKATAEERAEYRAWRVALSKQRMAGEGKHYFKAIDGSNGRLVGYVGFFNPSVDPAAQSTVPRPACVNPDTDQVMQRLQEVDRKWVGERKDVWYVPSLCVHPEYQGKGIAQRLLQRGLDEVDKLGDATIVEGTPAAQSVYRRCGFEMLEEVELLDGLASLAVMMRRAGGSSSKV